MSMLLSGKTTYGYSDFSDVPVMEGYDVETGGDAAAHQEFIQDMVGVYESMHALDMAEIELRRNNGGIALESCAGVEEFRAVQEGAASDIFEKIKAALKKLWGKIKGFFKSIRKYFDYLFMNGKDFAKKYQTDIIKASARADEDFKFKMYKFDDAKIDDVDGALLYAKATDLIDRFEKSNIGKVSELSNDDIEKQLYQPYRKLILGGTGSGDADDFSKDAFAYFRNGAESESDKEEINGSEVSAFVKVLTTNKTLSNLDKMERAMDSSFRYVIKEIDKLATEATKEGEENLAKEASKLSQCYEKLQSIASSFVRIWHQAVKDRASAYKQACMKVMTYRNKKK